MNSGTEDYRTVLRHEFGAEEGSFLLQLRVHLEWDRDAFDRLLAAMETCCRDHAGEEKLDRWLAEGFWYLTSFVRDWTTHPQFPRPFPEEYYDAAYQRLDELAEWFFTGESPNLMDEEEPADA